MAKIKISKEELQKMIEEQLNCSVVTWQKDGSIIAELDIEEIKRKAEKFEEHHHHYINTWPVYIKEPVSYKYVPQWTINKTTNSVCYDATYTGVKL